MSLAAETRAAVRARPFLLEALRAGVVNYAAAARTLDVAEDDEAVATALRRFAEQLPARESEARRVRVTMHGGVDAVDGGSAVGVSDGAPLLSIGEAAFGVGDGTMTGVLATGDVDVRALTSVLGVLDAHDVAPEAAGVAGEAMLVVVERRDGPEALRRVEESLSAVPGKPTG